MEHAHGEWMDKTTSQGQALVYICPMPEHVAIQYQHPGKCPLCGMTLAPVSPDQLAQIRPGAPVEYYTCPLPEHSDVREDKPGKCPRCGMTLIPVMKGPEKDGQVEGTDAHSKH
jgi:rubrerythrin